MDAVVAAWSRARDGAGFGSECDDSRLLARCRRGDRDAQEALVRRYQETVHRLAYALLGNPEEALDATQEALVAMLRSLSSYRGEARFETWLRGLVTRVCLMQRRRRRTYARHVAAMPVDAGERPSPEAGPEAAVIGQELHAALREHLRRLPAHFRAVVILRDMEGFSYEQIAEALRVPVGTVRSRLSRARRLLREAFARDDRISISRGGEGS